MQPGNIISESAYGNETDSQVAMDSPIKPPTINYGKLKLTTSKKEIAHERDQIKYELNLAKANISNIRSKMPSRGGTKIEMQKLNVAVRIRPLLPRDIGKDPVVYSDSSNSVRLTDMTKHLKFKYPQVFSGEDQEEVFKYLEGAVDKVVNGFNSTIFAYGQTGSGKTYTMFGKKSDSRAGSQ